MKPRQMFLLATLPLFTQGFAQQPGQHNQQPIMQESAKENDCNCFEEQSYGQDSFTGRIVSVKSSTSGIWLTIQCALFGRIYYNNAAGQEEEKTVLFCTSAQQRVYKLSRQVIYHNNIATQTPDESYKQAFFRIVKEAKANTHFTLTLNTKKEIMEIAAFYYTSE